MNRHSIKFKMTLLLSIVIGLLIIILLLANSFFAERYYQYDKRQQMLTGYDKINEIMKTYDGSNLSKDNLYDKMEQYTSNTAMSIIIVSSDWTTVYTNTSAEMEMLDRLKMSIFNKDMFHFEDVDIYREKKKEPYKSNITFDMEFSGVSETREILAKEDNYTLQKVYDKRLADYYYELWGTLENGCSIMMRASIQGIKDNVAISNKFITYIGLSILFLGMAAALVFSQYISKPIKQLSKIAERMAHLDFNVKYEGVDKGEIGVLGFSMNNMSMELESTISQLKTVNKQLQKDIDKKEKLEQMRTEFLSNVSHELKTPIALIQGYAEGLKEGIFDSPESMDFYCDVIMDEASKMNIMVKKLLTLNQLEFGNESLEMNRFDIVELVEAIVTANELRASQQGITIEFNPNEKHIDVWSDEYKIEEVVTNYLSNAINHCEFEKRIVIRIEKIEDCVRVYVYNTGKHIPEEDIERIWDKFYKVDKARTREYGGNGIGLSIVKAIMDSYGNSFGVSNVEGGVEFWFDLDGKA